MKAVFLDRDGVINTYPGDFEYVTSWAEFRFLPGIENALKKLNETGYEIFMISNQAGVGKGIYSRQTLEQITTNMLEALTKKNIRISGVYYCTHKQEEDCSCRKPKTGLIDNLLKRINLEKSYFVGDSILDIQTGKSAGLKTILVFSGREKPENKNQWQALPDFTAQDLSEAVDIILNLL